MSQLVEIPVDPEPMIPPRPRDCDSAGMFGVHYGEGRAVAACGPHLPMILREHLPEGPSTHYDAPARSHCGDAYTPAVTS